MINVAGAMELLAEWATLPDQKMIGQVIEDDESCM
jgi:hypothetical protein